MFVWGSGWKTIDLAVTGKQPCATCEKDRPFHVYLKYRYVHIYYLFKWVSERHYLRACEICSRGVELDKSQLQASVPISKDPIPFMDRLGWTIGLAILGALLLVPYLIEKFPS
jgi:hypothetical protein